MRESSAMVAEQGCGGVAVHWRQDRATASVASGLLVITSVHVALIQGLKDSHAGCRFGLCKHLEFVPRFSYCILQCMGTAMGTAMELSTSNSGGHLNSRAHLNWC